MTEPNIACEKVNNQIRLSIDNSITIHPECHVSDTSTLYGQQPMRLERLLKKGLSDSGYLSQKKKKEAESLSINTLAPSEDSQVEDPYRWVILLGGFLAQAIRVMQDYFDRQVFKDTINATELSFVGTLGFAFCGLMGPVTPFLISFVGARWLLFFGALLTSAGLVLASYSTKVWHLYITQSVMHGMGAALLYIVSMSISPQWFVKRRGFAMGIMVSGSGIGGLIMPIIMNSLNESLGGSWCYRVLGAITLVISLISAILLKERKLNKKAPKVAYKNMIDFSICKDVKFIIWCIAGNLSMLCYFVPAFYLPTHATKIGLPPSQGSALVAVFSAVNVVGRIISGYLGDQIGAVNVDIIFLFICGLSSLFIWTFAKSFVTLLIFIVIYGFVSGAVFSLLAPITAAVVGMEKYPSAICLYLFFMTAARFGPSLAGAIQTATDKHSFFTYQMFTGLSFVLSAFVAVYLKYKLQPIMLAKT